MEPVVNETKTKAPRARAPDARVYGRSKITNGSGSLLPTNDGRSLWARIRRDTIHSLIAMCGGADQVSETKSLAARRVGTLEAELVFMEDSFAAIRDKGGEPNPQVLDLYGRLADRQRRLSDPLGWQRVPKNVGPSLGQLLREDQEKERRRLAQEREQQTIEAAS